MGAAKSAQNIVHHGIGRPPDDQFASERRAVRHLFLSLESEPSMEKEHIGNSSDHFVESARVGSGREQGYDKAATILRPFLETFTRKGLSMGEGRIHIGHSMPVTGQARHRLDHQRTWFWRPRGYLDEHRDRGRMRRRSHATKRARFPA